MIIGLSGVQFGLGDLNYIFDCDWLTEQSDTKLSKHKLSDNNLASELAQNRSFLTNHNRGKCNFMIKLLKRGCLYTQVAFFETQ